MTTTTTTITTTGRDPLDVLGLAVLHLGGGILVALWMAAWWAVLFPMISVPLVLAVLAGMLVHPSAGLGVVGLAVAGLALWRLRSPQTFDRWVTARARARWLALFRYRRRWARLLTACQLVVVDGDQVRVPRLLDVRIGEADDIVRLRMVAGHGPDDYTRRAEQLAHAFGAEECRVCVTGPGLLELNFRYHDALAEPVDLPQIVDGTNWMKDAA
ncbi:hypothetical protein [Nocardia higoensis]|uniref:hypothetical protein n=1 Tax=Nocardia higoensis TaxID=228599 RepID=UPI0003041164|nr:hypothetical protein [Nocardia higoensis]